jgi:hypothetical protein
MVELQERSDIDPVCPHCKIELKNIAYRELSGMFGKRYVYFCPDCRSVLGVSHRKGFWMG